ncbi:Nucleolar protein 16, partial [Trichinella zimbabwensis]
MTTMLCNIFVLYLNMIFFNNNIVPIRSNLTCYVMARSTKRGGKKNRKVVFRKNRLKNKWKNEKRKRGIRVQNNLIQQAWDKSASNKKNMHRMGLVFDVNGRLSGMANEKAGNNEDNQTSKFIETFEEELKKRCVKSHYLPISELKFLAMERDSRNYFRRTSGQIRRAIQAFKKMPIHECYKRRFRSKWADCLLKSHSNILTRKNTINTKAMNARPECKTFDNCLWKKSNDLTFTEKYCISLLKHISNCFHRSIKSAASFYYFVHVRNWIFSNIGIKSKFRNKLQLSNILRLKLTRISVDVKELCLHHKEDLHSNLTELSVFLHCCYLLE